jgi:hypothetical protein
LGRSRKFGLAWKIEFRQQKKQVFLICFPVWPTILYGSNATSRRDGEKLDAPKKIMRINII